VNATSGDVGDEGGHRLRFSAAATDAGDELGHKPSRLVITLGYLIFLKIARSPAAAMRRDRHVFLLSPGNALPSKLRSSSAQRREIFGFTTRYPLSTTGNR